MRLGGSECCLFLFWMLSKDDSRCACGRDWAGPAAAAPGTPGAACFLFWTLSKDDSRCECGRDGAGPAAAAAPATPGAACFLFCTLSKDDSRCWCGRDWADPAVAPAPGTSGAASACRQGAAPQSATAPKAAPRHRARSACAPAAALPDRRWMQAVRLGGSGGQTGRMPAL